MARRGGKDVPHTFPHRFHDAKVGLQQGEAARLKTVGRWTADRKTATKRSSVRQLDTLGAAQCVKTTIHAVPTPKFTHHYETKHV